MLFFFSSKLKIRKCSSMRCTHLTMIDGSVAQRKNILLRAYMSHSTSLVSDWDQADSSGEERAWGTLSIHLALDSLQLVV